MTDENVATEGDEANAKVPTLTIFEIEFPYTEPYAAGHVVNEAEARVLNQTRRENLSNNFRPQVKKAIEEAEKAGAEVDVAALLDAFADVDANYVFTIANVAASRKLDPVEKEARSIARNYLKQELDKAGRKIKEVPEGLTEEEWENALAEEIERIASDPQVIEMAKNVVASKSAKLELALSV